MAEEQTVDVENINRLLTRFQNRLGELSATVIALENENERLGLIIEALSKKLNEESIVGEVLEPAESTASYREVFQQSFDRAE